jgi:hypothetical protein
MVLTALLFPLLLAPRTVGRVSYVPPEGWTVAATTDHETWTVIDQAKKRYCQICIYTTRAGSSDLDKEFAAEWKDIVKSDPPSPSPVSIAAGKAVAGSAMARVADQDAFTRLYLYDAGGGEVGSVVVLATDKKSIDAYRGRIDTLFANLTLGPKAEGVQAANAPPTAAAGGGKTLATVHVSDLVGRWTYSASSSMNYVTSYGSYAGSSNVAYGETYDLKANGSYAMSFQGVNDSGAVQEKDTGTFTLGPGLTFNGSRKTEKYTIVSYEIAPDGSARLKLLSASYDPANSADVSLYGETWVRAAPGK